MDTDVLAAIQSLAEAYSVYEQPPHMLIQRELYEALSKFLAEAKQQSGQASFGPAKDSEIYQLLVFLFRMGLMHTNGRPRARRYYRIPPWPIPRRTGIKTRRVSHHRSLRFDLARFLPLLLNPIPQRRTACLLTRSV